MKLGRLLRFASKVDLATQITKKARSNLAMSFFSLSPERRSDLEVFYAFCRCIDDIADDDNLSPEQRQNHLKEWKRWIEQIYTTKPDSKLAAALSDVVHKYLILPDHLREILLGVEMDLTINRYKDWKQLERYCYRVASCVGLVSIEIFGYTHPDTREYARLLGLALQITNILRDVFVDLKKGRVYLPEQDFIDCGTDIQILLSGKYDKQLLAVLHKMASRAEFFFNAAEKTLPEVDRPNMLAAQVMANVYKRILQKLKANNFYSIRSKFTLCGFERAFIVADTLRKEKLHRCVPKQKKIKHVVVIGAGIAGLVASTSLAKSGYKITLMESRASAGGRTHSWFIPQWNVVVDNGQHILMGCYHTTREWVEQLGAANFLPEFSAFEVPYALPSGRVVTLSDRKKCLFPLHLISAVSHFDAIGFKEKISCLQVVQSAFNARGAWAGNTVLEWLRSCGQSENLITHLWEPFAVAALNEPISSASAELFRNVLLEIFRGPPSNAHVLLPKCALSELLVKPALEFLRFAGGTVKCSCAVQTIRPLQQSSKVEIITQKAETICADAVICATGWASAAKLLRDADPMLAQKISHLTGAPIIEIHLVFKSRIFNYPFMGLLHSPIHWIFHLNSIRELNLQQQDQHYLLTISAAYRYVELPRAQLVTLALQEIARFFPQAAGLAPQASFVYKNRDATFAARPECLRFRPRCEESGTNIFLAGGWTDTGLPDTIEGAALSGKRAAQCVEEYFARSG